MATTTEPGGKQRNKSRPEKKAQNAQSSAHDKLKTVVRRLPPNLPEDIFWQSVEPWVSDETVSWRAFYPGKIRKKYNANKENIPSRAYIAFRTVENVAAFSQAYDGHIFRDKAGNETFAVVEFAPFQKIPPEKRKMDTRMGTIDQDEDYKSFIASLNTPITKPSEAETIEALVSASQPVEQPKTTPLLEALRAEKQAQRDRETILKAHAHYRDRNLAKDERGPRKKGKQPKGAPAERNEAPTGSGQGKRNRRGGKKGDAVVGGSTPKAKAKDTAPTSSAKILAKPPTKQGPQQEPVPATKEGAKEPHERRRPEIGARQFEVALAGAGVLMSGPDRKSRREREREKKSGEAAAPEEPVVPTDKGKEKVEKPQTQAGIGKEGKERSRAGRKRGDSAKSQAGSPATNVAESTAVPTILARSGNQPGIINRPVPSPVPDEPVVDGTPAEPISKNAAGRATPGEGRGEGRGGRRRGRGRGAPRGGAPLPAVQDPMQ